MSCLNRFGHLLHDAWELKKDLEPSISNAQIDAIYARARNAGALGGKLLGAAAALSRYLRRECPQTAQCAGIVAAMTPARPLFRHNALAKS